MNVPRRDPPDVAKARTEAAFTKQEEAREAANKARADYEAEGRARDEKTARLRALRLAKEAADRNADNTATEAEAKPTGLPRPRRIRC
jgi:hypothetical protein